MPKSIYIAGPMRGYKWFNFPAFDSAYQDLQNQSKYLKIISPANIDRLCGFDPHKDCDENHDWNVVPECLDIKDVMRRDLKEVMECDAIFMLKGWEKSKGARAEYSLAEALEKEILYQDSAVCKSDPQITNPDGEYVVENIATGAKKGQKLARFDLIPQYPLWKLAELYGRGAQKYAEHNWRHGYQWSLSFAACMRHLWSFWGGEDNDPETGMPHVTCAAFHAFALTQFMKDYQEGDDRFDW